MGGRRMKQFVAHCMAGFGSPSRHADRSRNTGWCRNCHASGDRGRSHRLARSRKRLRSRSWISLRSITGRHHRLPGVGHWITGGHHSLRVALLRITLLRITLRRVAWWIALRRRIARRVPRLRSIARRHHALGIALRWWIAWRIPGLRGVARRHHALRRIARGQARMAGLRVRHPGRGRRRIRIGGVLAHDLANGWRLAPVARLLCSDENRTKPSRKENTWLGGRLVRASGKGSRDIIAGKTDSSAAIHRRQQ